MDMQTAIQKRLDSKLAQAAVVQHNAVEEHETSTGLGHRKLLMWTFLGSECMFFGSLIATFLVYRNQSTVGPFPDEIIDVPITTVSTFVLLMSSLAMVLALNAVQRHATALAYSLPDVKIHWMRHAIHPFPKFSTIHLIEALDFGKFMAVCRKV